MKITATIPSHIYIPWAFSLRSVKLILTISRQNPSPHMIYGFNYSGCPVLGQYAPSIFFYLLLGCLSWKPMLCFRYPAPIMWIHRIGSQAFPILNILVPHTGHTPWVAGFPFFMVMALVSFISLLVRHFIQYACIRLYLPFSYDSV